jgi:hypothetical protein
MSRSLLARLAGSTLGAILILAGCSGSTPSTGARIEVQAGDGVAAPKYLLFDWRDSDSVLVHDRRVPETGFLDPGAHPLAVVRIAAEAVNDPQRHIVIRGMVGEQVVSHGEGSVLITAGSWQMATVVLQGEPAVNPDAGAPPADAGEVDSAVEPTDAAGLEVAADAGAPDQTDTAAPPPVDADLVDRAPDLPGPDLPHDLAADVPATAVVISASADSYAEQGGNTSSMNFGRVTVLEVKNQGGSDNNRIAFFRFPLTAAAGSTPITAMLRLYGKGGGTNMLSAYGVMDETWTETGINWNNKPAVGAKQSTLPTTTTPQYREWNVTPFVKAQLAAGRDNVNFALSMDNETVNNPDTYNSRENAANQPQLVITR